MTTARQPTDIDAHVSRRVREIRVGKEMSMMDLGEKLGVSHQQVAKYESGTNRISAGRLWSIAEVLGVPVMAFFERTGQTAEAAE